MNGDIDLDADRFREAAREAVLLARLEALARGGPEVEAPARAIPTRPRLHH